MQWILDNGNEGAGIGVYLQEAAVDINSVDDGTEDAGLGLYN